MNGLFQDIGQGHGGTFFGQETQFLRRDDKVAKGRSAQILLGGIGQAQAETIARAATRAATAAAGTAGTDTAGKAADGLFDGSGQSPKATIVACIGPSPTTRLLMRILV